ncbi:LacI family transcriptional regulator [Ruminococcaceae bacterium OttesenSCG-928-I18]|nr:LacI family transcriptional regulator [Ruminococcaceae bacterium OttesenSCG-928-I18]
MKATMKDVARRAGVSVSTVSHVINQTRFVNGDTTERVQKAIKDLHYQPNDLARSLRVRSTKTIGMVVADLNNDHFLEIIRACENNANRYGYNTILCNTQEDPKKEKMYLQLLLQKQIDGIILAPTCQNRSFIRNILDTNLPLVFIDRYMKDMETCYVGVDSYSSSRDATKRILDLGYRRIDMPYALRSLWPVDDRIRGFQDALREYGIPEENSALIEFEDYEDKTQTVERFETFYKDRPLPELLFVAGNKLTLAAVHFLHKRGVDIPEETAVAGFGSFKWNEDFTPHLSMVETPVFEMGLQAVDLLMERIEMGVQENKTVLLPTKFACYLPEKKN